MTYQEKAYTTAAYGQSIEYPFCSLPEEAGEVMGKLNKYMRKHNVFMNDAILAAAQPSTEVEHKLREDLIKELGDLRWNIAACCTELGITEEELEQANLGKLQTRVQNGTLDSAGDTEEERLANKKLSESGGNLCNFCTQRCNDHKGDLKHKIVRGEDNISVVSCNLHKQPF